MTLHHLATKSREKVGLDPAAIAELRKVLRGRSAFAAGKATEIVGQREIRPLLAHFDGGG